MNFSHMSADQMTFGSLLVISYSLSNVPWWINSPSASELSGGVCIAAPAPRGTWRNKNSASFDVICMTATYFCPFVLSNVTEMLNGKSVLLFWMQREVILETLWLLIACCVFGRQNDALTVLWPSIWTAQKANQAQNEEGTLKASLTRFICWKQVTWMKGLIRPVFPIKAPLAVKVTF